MPAHHAKRQQPSSETTPRATMNISLPSEMREWIEQQVTAGGFGTVSEYIRHIVREVQKQQFRDEIAAKLLEAMNEPSTPMTRDDWTNIRRDALRRLEEQRNGRRRKRA
jgi:antitoxin ParD1/3/4